MYNAYYTYNGFTGTLYELCKIFNKDIKDVRKILEHCKGFLFETEALEKAPFKSVQQPITNETYEIPNFLLSDKQWELEKTYHKLFEKFISNRKITDEDLKSDLYMCYLFIISKSPEIPEKKRHYYGIKVSADLKNRYIQLCKKEYAKKQIKSLNEFVTVELIDTVDDNIYQKQLKDNLEVAFKTLKEREVEALNLRFGLDGQGCKTLQIVGEHLTVSGSRAQQIGYKAMRKLRHPSRSVRLFAFICDDTDTINAQQIYDYIWNVRHRNRMHPIF